MAGELRKNPGRGAGLCWEGVAGTDRVSSEAAAEKSREVEVEEAEERGASRGRLLCRAKAEKSGRGREARWEPGQRASSRSCRQATQLDSPRHFWLHSLLPAPLPSPSSSSLCSHL